MIRNLFFSSQLIYPIYLSIFFLFFCSIDGNAQCAGNDNSLTLCSSDITNPSNKSIDLNLLLGAHTTGGTWTDDNNSGGLDTNTGVLNAQQIFVSGMYHYTYTVNGDPSCTDNNAVIEVIIGGYTGIPGPNNSICSSDHSYSLFQVFQGIPVLAPQSGGTWNDDNNSGGLSPNSGILDASVPIPGRSYFYTYTIPAIGTCTAVSAQISVSIYRSPESGTPSSISLCSNQVSTYTNVDLYDQLSGEDAGGVWTESGTSELTDPTDSFIDIQNIYNTHGAGVYRFTYTVRPPKDDRVCTIEDATVTIAIGKQLDFTGATLVVNPDVCENDMATTTYTGILRQGVNAIANGIYRVDYTISGVGSFNTIQNFSNGVLIFPISSSNFTEVKDYNIRISNVTLVSSPVFCSSLIGTIEDVLHIYPSPKINDATLTINPVCQGSEAFVEFSGTSNLSDGNYDIIYRISGSNNLNGIPATMNVISGVSSFTIPSVYIPKTGTTTVTITKITNVTSNCSNTATLTKDFIINPSLDLNNLGIAINDVCQNQPAEVTLTGLGVLTDIDVTYNLSGANNSISTTVSLIATSSQGNFQIPATDIPNTGLTTLTITNVTNTITGCTFVVNNKKASFTIITPPAAPIVIGEQPFCSANNSTVADLLPQGVQFQWFDSETSTIPLDGATALTTGNYFVNTINQTTGCISSLATVHVTINSTPQIDSARLSIATTCQSYNITVLLGGSSNLVNGDYNILYDLSGDNIATGITAVLTVKNGIGIFRIPATLAPNAGATTVLITNITNPITRCTNTVNLSESFTTNPLPDISNLVISINDVCQGQPATIELSGLVALTTININFSLSGANTIPLHTVSLVVVDEKVSIEIPAANLSNIGLTTFNLTNITDTANGCPIFMDIKTDFSVNALPDTSTMDLSVNDSCPNQPLDVAISGLGNLTNITINYVVSGANTISSQTIPLVVTGGSANFLIPGNLLGTAGANTIIITDLTNSITGCSSVVSSISKDFNVLPTPNDPIANNQEFCKEDLATVANLEPKGIQFDWYDSLSSTTPLSAETLLATANYYLKETNSTTGCVSNATMIDVKINSIPTPILNPNGQEFCGADKPTIQNLSNNTDSTETIIWYNTPTNGTALANTEFLTEGTTYYGINYNPITKCTSSEVLEVTVTLKVCNVPPDGLFIPDGFSPNGDGVNDTFKIRDIEYLFPNFTLEIYNRYGNIMFKGDINRPEWDGKNSNSSFINGDSATGVYFYIINYNKNNFSPRQGQLYLNR
jgi:trimeric autotransporter adhesin